MKSWKILFPGLFLAFTVLLTSCGSEPEVPKYERFSYELVPIKSGDKWGFIDTKGNLAVNPQFKDARPFADGRAAVCSQDDQWGFIDSTGNYVINPIYKFVTDFSEGFAGVVRPNGKPELIDTAGNIKQNFSNAIDLGVSKDGLMRFVEETKDEYLVGYYSTDGKVSISAQFYQSFGFSEGLAGFTQKTDEDTLYGFINREGKTVINPQFDWAGQFSDSLALIEVDEKYGYINSKGKIVINPQFDSAKEFHQGLAAIKMGDQWGFIDKKGKIVINPQFESAMSFKNNVAAVQLSENKWGYIDTLGKYKINPQFKAAGSFDHPNFAAVKIGDKIGFIDSLGKYVANPQYDAAYIWSYEDFMGEHNPIDNVHTNYIDFEQFFEKLFDKNFNNLKNYKLGQTQKEIREKHELDKVEVDGGELDVDLLIYDDIFDGIAITTLTYGFDGSLTSNQRYIHHSDYYYNYYGTRTVMNENVRVNKLLAVLSMGWGVGYDRQEEIAEKIVAKLEKVLGVKSEVDDYEDIKSRVLEKNGRRYFIRWSDTNSMAILMRD